VVISTVIPHLFQLLQTVLSEKEIFKFRFLFYVMFEEKYFKISGKKNQSNFH